MNWSIITPVAVGVLIALAGCDKAPETPSTVPHVITADIQAGIEKHIDEQTRLGDGYYNIDYEGKPLNLKLVRVHTEYLANLG
ncbi:MAG: transglutaminase domain-containing protein, partial [Planctomycetota bacterium]